MRPQSVCHHRLGSATRRWSYKPDLSGTSILSARQPPKSRCSDAKSNHHSPTDSLQISCNHLFCNVNPLATSILPNHHTIQPLQRDRSQHVALGPGLSPSKLPRQRTRVHPMVERLHGVRGRGTQRYDGAKLVRAPGPGRDHHYRSPLDHLRGLEAGVEIADQHHPWFGVKGKRHPVLVVLVKGFGNEFHELFRFLLAATDHLPRLQSRHLGLQVLGGFRTAPQDVLNRAC